MAEIPPAGHGPSFSVAGAAPGTAQAVWRTAMPDPSRNVLDAYGHIITKAEAEADAGARLVRCRGVLTLRASTRRQEHEAA